MWSLYFKIEVHFIIIVRKMNHSVFRDAIFCIVGGVKDAMTLLPSFIFIVGK